MCIRDSVKAAGQDVPIRKGYVCDATGYIKVTLWRKYTSLIHEKYYTFMSLVKSTFNSVCQLQTCNSTSHKLIPTLVNTNLPTKIRNRNKKFVQDYRGCLPKMCPLWRRASLLNVVLVVDLHLLILYTRRKFGTSMSRWILPEAILWQRMNWSLPHLVT